MGRVRNWQDWDGQRGLVLESLAMKTVESGLAKTRGPNGFTINDKFGSCPQVDKKFAHNSFGSCSQVAKEFAHNLLIRS